MSKKEDTMNEQTAPKTRYDRKMEARKKAAAKDKRDTLILKTICIIIIGAIIGTIGYFSIKKVLEVQAAINDPYVAVGEHQLTQLEYDYYFNSTVNNYINSYSYYLNYIGLDVTQPFEEQQYSEDMTWQEFFEQMTLDQIKQELALLDDAKANNFEYDATEEYNEFVTTAKTTARESQMTTGRYYKSIFGDYATANNIKPFMENSFIAGAYHEKLIEDNTPSEDEATDYYEEHKNDYDKATFYSFMFDPADYDADADLKTMAEEMLSRVEDGEDFETLCIEYAANADKELYEEEDNEFSLTADMTCSYANADYTSWICDEARKKGDTTLVEDSESGMYYVLKFVKRTYDETCLETISSTLATDAVTEYLTGLTENNYDYQDIKGEISYLSETENNASEDTTSDSSNADSLLDTSVIE